MLNFLRRTSIVYGSYGIGVSSTAQKLFIPEKHLLSVRYISSTSNQHSFIVSYLINSCGFSPETALSASKNVNFQNPEKPDLVIRFFRNNGFSQPEITSLIQRVPSLLLSNPEKTLLPKVEFLHSVGFLSPDIVKVLSSNARIWQTSLEKQIIPSFVFFKNLLRTDEKTITAIKRFSYILTEDVENRAAPNISLLRENGVPESNLITLIKTQPRVIVTTPVRFKKIVEEVKEMGFNPLRLRFVQAVGAMRSMSKSTWEKKVNAYKRWGLSKEDVLVTFGKHPCCILASEDKITGVMEFLTDKMGLESSIIVDRPMLLSLSLDKRIIPRGLVILVLLSKGLVKKNISLSTVFGYADNLFLQKFVMPYKEEAPELLELYKGKIGSFKVTGEHDRYEAKG